MSSPGTLHSNRRDFLTGRAVLAAGEAAGARLADRLKEAESRGVPRGGDARRLQTRAMACDFSVFLNTGPSRELMRASDALEMLHPLEDQMTVFRAHSELSRLNRRAFDEAVEVEPRLFALLSRARDLALATEGAFDPTSGPLVALWRRCRHESRIPMQDEIDAARARTGIEHVRFDEDALTIRYAREGMELNLGGIGKGHALDRCGEFLLDEEVADWMFHGGHSSILARGAHFGADGWPIAVSDPIVPRRRFGTVLLRDQGFSTSGSAVQYFRHGGKRYGHILDPRTGWPVESMLSAMVFAPTAAEADALSTAFFVMGLEKSRAYCDNHPHVAAILLSSPRRNRRVEPVLCNVPEGVLFLEDD